MNSTSQAPKQLRYGNQIRDRVLPTSLSTTSYDNSGNVSSSYYKPPFTWNNSNATYNVNQNNNRENGFDWDRTFKTQELGENITRPAFHRRKNELANMSSYIPVSNPRNAFK